MSELYKSINKIAPPVMNFLFLFRENVHNIRTFQILSNSTNKTVSYDLTVLYRSPFSGTNLLQGYKSKTSLHVIKVKIRKWNAENSACRLCKHFEGNLSFI